MSPPPLHRTLSLLLLTALLALPGDAHGQTVLGGFTFADGLFGDSVLESDGGARSSQGGLHVRGEMPSGSGVLVGAHFNTGVANIDRISYTIGYGPGIRNEDGGDLGVVVARFSADPFDLAVSLDGVHFGPSRRFEPGSAFATGVARTFHFAGYPGPLFQATLFVQPIDLTDFGVGLGGSVAAVRITGYGELDLIRVAGFASAATPESLLREGLPVIVNPEPGSWALLLAGLAGLGVAARRRRRPGAD